MFKNNRKRLQKKGTIYEKKEEYRDNFTFDGSVVDAARTGHTGCRESDSYRAGKYGRHTDAWRAGAGIGRGTGIGRDRRTGVGRVRQTGDG